METDDEWELIKNTIQKKSTGGGGGTAGEWHIGLYKNKSNGNWTWVNGKPLTIQQWQPTKPTYDPSDYVALIAKSWPAGYYGKFNNVREDIYRAYICENITTGEKLQQARGEGGMDREMRISFFFGSFRCMCHPKLLCDK